MNEYGCWSLVKWQLQLGDRRTVRKVRANLLLPVSKTIRPHDIRGRYSVVMKIVNHQLSGVSNTSLVALVGSEHCAC